MTWLMLVVALLCAAPASAQSLAPSLALIGGSTADLLTTLAALRTVSGAREANPLLAHGGTVGLVAVKAGVTGVLVYGLRRLAPRHPRWAQAIGFGGGAVLAGVAVRNARLQ